METQDSTETQDGPSSAAAVPPLPAGAWVDDDGTFGQLLNRSTGAGPRPALFLDRDGVVIEEAHYLQDPAGAHLIPGATDVIGLANRIGIPVVIVTNQSGIGRGYYGWTEFVAVQEKILDDLSEADVYVNAVFACPHHDNGVAPYDVADHPDRKPNPGMLLKAGDILRISYTESWIVGDHATDIGAGYNGGLAGGLHVLTGHGSHEGQRERALEFHSGTFQSLAGNSIANALDLPVFTGL